jgi:hypothetical protein
MIAITLNKTNEKILIVGPIYDKIDKIESVTNIIDNYDLVIFNGSLCFPYSNIAKVKDRIAVMDNLLKNNKVIYNISDLDLTCTSQAKDIQVNKWILSKSNVVIIKYVNKPNIIITSGGIPTKVKYIENLTNNLETSFVSIIENKPWHTSYNGMLGYVISNNPLTNNEPELYDYSAQIGNIYSSQNNVYAQEIDRDGLKKTILL